MNWSLIHILFLHACTCSDCKLLNISSLYKIVRFNVHVAICTKKKQQQNTPLHEQIIRWCPLPSKRVLNRNIYKNEYIFIAGSKNFAFNPMYLELDGNRSTCLTTVGSYPNEQFRLIAAPEPYAISRIVIEYKHNSRFRGFGVFFLFVVFVCLFVCFCFCLLLGFFWGGRGLVCCYGIKFWPILGTHGQWAVRVTPAVTRGIRL